MTNPIKPILSNSHFVYKGVRYLVEFHEIGEKESIPNLPWSQVYVVGNYNGKVPIVKYKSAKDNLPGGGIESNETIEQALRREILEELNMKVTGWIPLGYQKNTGDNGEVYYQLRVYATLDKYGDFVTDTGGSVIGYDLINIENLNDHIKWGEVGDWLVARTISYF